MEILEFIIKSILTTIYRQFGFAIILAFFIMFFYMYVKEHGCRNALRTWLLNFRTNKKFQCVFLFALYGAMLGSCTLFNRDLWMNPMSRIMEGWGLYDADGQMTTEAIENFALFIPLPIFVFGILGDTVLKNRYTMMNVLGKSVVMSFVTSLVIEFCQLFLRLGTFQVSDLCYNTLGGMLGGLIYWCGYKITHRKNKD